MDVGFWLVMIDTYIGVCICARERERERERFWYLSMEPKIMVRIFINGNRIESITKLKENFFACLFRNCFHKELHTKKLKKILIFRRDDQNRKSQANGLRRLHF